MKAAGFILLLAFVLLLTGGYVAAAFGFLAALVVLVGYLPPSCTKACNQGRRGCTCRGAK